MGRFKIYNPNNLVNILNDTNFARCLLCEKKLKNIMGNIKRHYEQMHSVILQANESKRKKSKKKTKKRQQDDKDYKVNIKPKKSMDINNQNTLKINKAIKKEPALTVKRFEHNMGNECQIGNMSASTTVIKGISLHNGLVPPVAHPETNSKKIEELSDLKRKKIVQLESVDNSTTTTNTKFGQVDNDTNVFGTLAISKESTNIVNDNKEKEVSNIKTDANINKSSFKKIKLNAENDKIPATCQSFINNILFTSLDSCHQDEFLNCLIQTKTQLNIPLRNLQLEDTFKTALQSWEENFKVMLSSQTISENIERMAHKLRQEITKIVSNRLVYLKLDVISSMESNVMLVNIQFIKDFEIKIFTLSALELSHDHLASFLKKKVISILECYKIDINRVYTITRDNDKNFRGYFNEDTINICPEQEMKNDTNVHYELGEYCQNLSEKFPGHAMHFVACDVIKQLNENISQSRDSAKCLRLQMFQLNMKPIPVLDNDISWFSIYDMINSLLSVREKVENNSLLLVEVDWVFAQKFVNSFKPIVDTAVILQSNTQFIMGDFYREWLLCEINLEELSVSNELALFLLHALRKRKKDLFENTLFLAALYLDPRFCYMGSLHLSDKQKEMAIIQLLQIFTKLQTIHENERGSNTLSTLTAKSVNDRYSKLEKIVAQNMPTDDRIKMKMMCNNDCDSFRDVDSQWVKEALEQLQFEERLPFNTNILNYWKMAKYRNPVLAKITETALSVPATQATITRALSKWQMTLLKHNSQVHKNNIENILLLKLNQDLVDNISLEE